MPIPMKSQILPSDIDIAQQCKMKPIEEIADIAGIPGEYLEFYGKYKAKINLELMEKLLDKPDGKLILVTAMTGTPAGSGKTCTAIGITQALGKLGKKVICCLREPSLGPTFGMKGGAAGGGFSQVVPMEDINLHFTGDFHAVSTAHNLLAAMVDNHISRGDSLEIDPLTINWKRVIDMNDRALRQIVIGLGGRINGGVPRESGFEITAASEVMAILALSTDLQDLKSRLSNIVVGYTYDKKPVKAGDLKAEGSMALLLKEAIKPNLVQTLEGQPVFIHCGPFGNIAHGTNSVLATKMALKLADYVVTEAGFATDLGAEKFCHIVCRAGGFKPDAAILVVSLRALHMHGGVEKGKYHEMNMEALRIGLDNLDKHIDNLYKFGFTPIVAINKFMDDDEQEIQYLMNYCSEQGYLAQVSDVVSRGSEGGLELTSALLPTVDIRPSRYRPIYDSQEPIKHKIQKIAQEIYGAEDVEFTPKAVRDMADLESSGFSDLMICIAKTNFSLSDDPKKLNRPKGWKLTVRELKPSVGAGFIVVYTGEIMTMPGLPDHPAAERINIDAAGKITGLS